ncbi:MAG: hypothetical protein OXB84_03700 [Halobacteriovoraceae bacterium]|nr:hypothetical protein [Halobacteriovoraceae bacterium]
MKVFFLALFFVFPIFSIQDVEAQDSIVGENALTIDDVQQKVDQEVSEKINEKNEELDKMIDERADKFSNELTAKGQHLSDSVYIGLEELTNVLRQGADFLIEMIEWEIANLNEGLEKERQALHQKADENAEKLQSEVRDILVREIKEYSEQSEFVVKSFFFDAIFSETPICGIVEEFDQSTEWITLHTKMDFSPLNNQIPTLKFNMGAILRHFRTSVEDHHATFSNINTAYHTGQLFCMAIHFRKDMVSSWVEFNADEQLH